MSQTHGRTPGAGVRIRTYLACYFTGEAVMLPLMPALSSEFSS